MINETVAKSEMNLQVPLNRHQHIGLQGQAELRRISDCRNGFACYKSNLIFGFTQIRQGLTRSQPVPLKLQLNIPFLEARASLEVGPLVTQSLTDSQTHRLTNSVTL